MLFWFVFLLEEILIRIICGINDGERFFEKVAFPLVENRGEGAPPPRSEHGAKAHVQRT